MDTHSKLELQLITVLNYMLTTPCFGLYLLDVY